jgi:hypothetical protein
LRGGSPLRVGVHLVIRGILGVLLEMLVLVLVPLPLLMLWVNNRGEGVG